MQAPRILQGRGSCGTSIISWDTFFTRYLDCAILALVILRGLVHHMKSEQSCLMFLRLLTSNSATSSIPCLSFRPRNLDEMDQNQEAEKAMKSTSHWEFPINSLPVAHITSTLPGSSTTLRRADIPAKVLPENKRQVTPQSEPLSLPILQTTTNSPTPGARADSDSDLAGKKRTINDLESEVSEYGLIQFVTYDSSHFEDNSVEPSPKRRRRDHAAQTHQRCAGCRKEFAHIGDHFRRLRSNKTRCSGKRYQIKLTDGQWGEELAYVEASQL
ncbi:hypothetical protein C8F04DRAFT_1145946 [Mycena alexandri]|uniref:Uncharacterized protein n=1 Tax=Mycena alexandri TaxID=1745969 RepID=A0AAD6S484_9AGAR|nr:hypothetical protein C8F04DRAFT_1145946 [Mycena alexandri]